MDMFSYCVDNEAFTGKALFVAFSGLPNISHRKLNISSNKNRMVYEKALLNQQGFVFGQRRPI